MTGSISVEITESITSIEATNASTALTISPTVTTVNAYNLALPEGVTPASAITSVAYGSVTATNVQDALEQLADQFYRGTGEPSGTNLGEGDLWYDTANEELRVYREISSGSFAWIALVAGGYITGETSLMDKLDGGYF